ncbi:efflux RND transporter permease subunit [Clostridium sp. CX1]|uniref:Efflux RND transporter permease subunit n=1 Tax=Clostridium tanneri TaxID=3037988 RepID=A0ABU4JWR3_9CLOT|nr:MULTISPECIES: efflux RND transporter permease subunit [unclassified Clostridium]MCT8975021.1 efflux RND transporter permease subunit [Clostridium sp. CX1]MDW8802605.1 efflux RND transporter permease subunit [Clostridium sp. A1-XYC3]
MKITEISVKRPAAMWMVVVLLVALGIIGYKSMGANLLPSMDIASISVMTTYNGASAEDIKKDVVEPIEDAVSGISGLDKVNSTAKEGYGTVTINFKMGVNLNTAYLDVQKAVENASRRLPANADKPTIFKMDTNAIPVLGIALSGDISYDELYNESDILKDKLEKIPGVGSVSLLGSEKKELIIKLDKTAMEYYGIGVNTVVGKLNSVNANVPAGEIKQDKMNQSVRVIGQFKNIDDVKNMLVPTTGGGTIRLGDIAEINLEVPEAESLTRFSGRKTMAIIVSKQSDANVVKVADSIKKELETIKKTFPSGVKAEVAFDTTTFITSSLKQVQHNLLEGIATTAVVLYLFFRSFRSSLVVLISIPTSLIATFFMMYKLNFSLNMMSLMGLSLVVGTLVDDSIVVIESIQRHLGLGKDPKTAAIQGRDEVGMAAVAISLCDVVVFAPIAFMSGMIGQMFKEFGLTIVVATMFSLLVSFTVTPMLSSRVLKRDKGEENGKFFTKLIKKYREILIWSLEHRWKVLTPVLIAVVFSISLIPMGVIKTELTPVSDQSSFTIDVALSPGSTLQQTNDKITQIEKHLSGIKEVKNYFTMIGQSGMGNGDKASGQVMVTLVPKNERKKTQSELAAEVRDFGKNIPGIDFNVTESQSAGGSSKPISISIKGKDRDTLADLSNEVEKIVKKVPGVIDVSNSSNTKSSELKVNIDSLAAAQYGISTLDVGTSVRTALAGTSAGIYRANNEQNDITVKFMDNQIKNAEDIKSIKIGNSLGQQISLSQVATVVKEDSQPSLSREDKQDVITISANLQGKTLGEASKAIQTALKPVSMPQGYSINFGGNQEDMAESFRSLILALAASLALVYMILVVLYESFLTPAIRMVALPCAIIGALGLLALTGQTLSIMSAIGFIMLEGLASKNGTLLIDYANTLMKKGMSLKDALIESGTTRLRPIIMTSATMIVSMLPIALAIGEGSEMKKGMAIVIIGGMVMSTVLSPIVVPIVYTLMDDLKNAIFGRKKRSVKGVQQYEV